MAEEEKKEEGKSGNVMMRWREERCRSVFVQGRERLTETRSDENSRRVTKYLWLSSCISSEEVERGCRTRQENAPRAAYAKISFRFPYKPVHQVRESERVSERAG